MFKNTSFVFLLLFITPFLLANERLVILKGCEINSYAKEITDLSLIVYKEYPYLYEGTVEEYFPIIQHYSESKHGIAVALFDNEDLIGIAIGMPLKEMNEKYHDPLVQASIDFNAFYYLGEFLLLREYRGQGLGKKMYQAFEGQVRDEKCFNALWFCKIDENETSPLMPPNYRPLDGFWRKLGFEKCDNLRGAIYWQNVNETEVSPHDLVYWKKNL